MKKVTMTTVAVKTEESEESGNESEGEGECAHMSERYSEGNVILDESDESNDDWEADSE